MNEKIISLRMERQHFTEKANEEEYISLYRDLQPGQNVYWNGFGQPPTLSFRAAFDDIEFNRERQRERKLVKARFGGGNLGWIEACDMEIFASLYRKDIKQFSLAAEEVLELIERQGPLNIQQIKEETGLLVKEITPVLHKLQEAFLVYEDQYDGEWDRGWYRFSEMFPDVNTSRYTKTEALKILLCRFAYRHVYFDCGMAKSFYKVSEKEIKIAVSELIGEGKFIGYGNGYMLKDDAVLLENYTAKKLSFVYALHRNDFLYKSNENALKEMIKPMCDKLIYDCDPLQYLLIDGKFCGVVVGHFRNGPYDLNDVVCSENAFCRRDEIIEAVKAVNFGQTPKRFMGEEI